MIIIILYQASDSSVQEYYSKRMDYAQGTIIIITMNQEKNGISSDWFMDVMISNGVDKELQVHTEPTCE